MRLNSNLLVIFFGVAGKYECKSYKMDKIFDKRPNNRNFILENPIFISMYSSFCKLENY